MTQLINKSTTEYKDRNQSYSESFAGGLNTYAPSTDDC